jgi:hypothetical protein
VFVSASPVLLPSSGVIIGSGCLFLFGLIVFAVAAGIALAIFLPMRASVKAVVSV